MCTDGTELDEAFEAGRTAGKAEMACECIHRKDCHLRPPETWWRRMLEAFA